MKQKFETNKIIFSTTFIFNITKPPAMMLHSLLTTAQFKQLVKSGAITLGGNKVLKIYGTLHCTSGKRMKRQNRVFFSNEAEAIAAGCRPCGHCMREKYKVWKTTHH